MKKYSGSVTEQRTHQIIYFFFFIGAVVSRLFTSFNTRISSSLNSVGHPSVRLLAVFNFLMANRWWIENARLAHSDSISFALAPRLRLPLVPPSFTLISFATGTEMAPAACPNNFAIMTVATLRLGYLLLWEAVRINS